MKITVEENWECAICLAPAKFRKMKTQGGIAAFSMSFPMVLIEKGCTCEEDRFMNRVEGRFMSPETW